MKNSSGVRIIESYNSKRKKAILIFFDVFFTALIWFIYFATYIFGDYGSLSQKQIITMSIFIVAMVLLVVLAFVVTRCYRILLRNIGTLDIAKVGLVATSVQFLALIFLTIAPDTYIPRDGTDIIFFKWFFAALANVFFVTAYRVVPRIYRTYRFNLGEANVATRTIIIGAGLAGKLVFDESVRNVDFHNRIVAFVDDDCNKIGGSISNVPVVGPISNAKDFIKKYKAEEVIIAISDLDSKHLREILALLSGADVKIRRMPLLSEMSGPNDRRVVDVNLDELLCRDPVELDNHEIFNMLNGKSVLITGAGGSIGSELTRQIFNAHPSTLVLFDIYENSTYDIQMELCQRMRDEGIKDVKLVTLIGSTYNETRLEQIFKKYHPDYIYHAAAYKHVPLMEDSPMEAIRTNVVGTYNVARLADKYKAKKMVLVSTDKAVRPTNTMGATKRFAETIIQYFAEKSKHTAYAAVRFGNVLGSNGSVVPLFKKQIEAGGPVTLTHKDIIRYFMTIPEAVSLILQSSIYATGGEIFILDMGNPVKIKTLAEMLIRQMGHSPYRDIDIVETGLRPGEKLYEELLLDKEHQKKTPNEKIYIEETEEKYDVESNLNGVVKAFDLEDNDDIKKLLASMIPTYQYPPKKQD